MARCAGNKPDGEPCERIVSASQTYCFAHDPANAERRSRSASRAARSKPNRELAALKAQLRAVADGVLGGTVEPKRGAVAVQALSALIRAIEQERKIRELEELEERIAALEERRKEIA
jgi:hypothetical protein